MNKEVVRDWVATIGVIVAIGGFVWLLVQGGNSEPEGSSYAECRQRGINSEETCWRSFVNEELGGVGNE